MNSNSENAIALGLVVLANWFLAHLANDWTMPPEVQSAVQSMLMAGLGAWFRSRMDTTPAVVQALPAGPVIVPAH